MFLLVTRLAVLVGNYRQIKFFLFFKLKFVSTASAMQLKSMLIISKFQFINKLTVTSQSKHLVETNI